MLMPMLSVSTIGLVGLTFIAARKAEPLRALLIGLTGAWGGLCPGRRARPAGGCGGSQRQLSAPLRPPDGAGRRRRRAALS